MWQSGSLLLGYAEKVLTEWRMTDVQLNLETVELPHVLEHLGQHVGSLGVGHHTSNLLILTGYADLEAFAARGGSGGATPTEEMRVASAIRIQRVWRKHHARKQHDGHRDGALAAVPEGAPSSATADNDKRRGSIEAVRAMPLHTAKAMMSAGRLTLETVATASETVTTALESTTHVAATGVDTLVVAGKEGKRRAKAVGSAVVRSSPRTHGGRLVTCSASQVRVSPAQPAAPLKLMWSPVPRSKFGSTARRRSESSKRPASARQCACTRRTFRLSCGSGWSNSAT